MSDPIARIGNYLARDYLSVNGVVVATEGDVCREFSICEPTWTKQGLKNACDTINGMDSHLRQSVRRLVGSILPRIDADIEEARECHQNAKKNGNGLNIQYYGGKAVALEYHREWIIPKINELSALIDGKDSKQTKL